MALFSTEGVLFLLRWIHFMAGITWIGLLYYFNFVQGSFMAEAGTEPARPFVTRKLLPRALWWFRWGAMFTFLSGLAIILINVAEGGTQVLAQNWGVLIQIGALLGTLMFLNVWLIIWPKQKIVIASAEAVANGGQADPAAAAAAPRAFLASRTNTLFSIPMLFFMGAARHLSVVGEGAKAAVPAAICTVIILAFEANAIWGKKNEGPSKMLEKHVAVIHVGLVLALVLYLVVELLT
ncbi:MAG: urate hydroxylase PuuD [Myxococcota bacterium]